MIIDQHLQSLIELAYKTDQSQADYHLNKLISEIGRRGREQLDISDAGLKVLASFLRT